MLCVVFSQGKMRNSSAVHFSESAAPLATGFNALDACFLSLFFHLYFFVESYGHHSFMLGILQWERLPGFVQRPFCVSL